MQEPYLHLGYISYNMAILQIGSQLLQARGKGEVLSTVIVKSQG